MHVFEDYSDVKDITFQPEESDGGGWTFAMLFSGVDGGDSALTFNRWTGTTPSYSGNAYMFDANEYTDNFYDFSKQGFFES